MIPTACGKRIALPLFDNDTIRTPRVVRRPTPACFLGHPTCLSPACLAVPRFDDSKSCNTAASGPLQHQVFTCHRGTTLRMQLNERPGLSSLHVLALLPQISKYARLSTHYTGSSVGPPHTTTQSPNLNIQRTAICGYHAPLTGAGVVLSSRLHLRQCKACPNVIWRAETERAHVVRALKISQACSSSLFQPSQPRVFLKYTQQVQYIEPEKECRNYWHWA